MARVDSDVPFVDLWGDMNDPEVLIKAARLGGVGQPFSNTTNVDGTQLPSDGSVLVETSSRGSRTVEMSSVTPIKRLEIKRCVCLSVGTLPCDIS